jgi:predicted O-methyltransferase YrrM
MPFEQEIFAPHARPARVHAQQAVGGSATAVLDPPRVELSPQDADPTPVGASPQQQAAGLGAQLGCVDGMVSDAEAECLFDLARSLRSGAIVEVGTYRGRAAAALGLGSLAGAGLPVFAIDPHEPFTDPSGARFGPDDRGAFYRAMLETGCERIVRLVNHSSEGAALGFDHPVGLLFLDGDPSREAVRRDWEAWRPHLRDGALVVLRDASDERFGPRRLIEEATAAGLLDARQRVGHLGVFRYRLRTPRG